MFLAESGVRGRVQRLSGPPPCSGRLEPLEASRAPRSWSIDAFREPTLPAPINNALPRDSLGTSNTRPNTFSLTFLTAADFRVTFLKFSNFLRFSIAMGN